MVLVTVAFNTIVTSGYRNRYGLIILYYQMKTKLKWIFNDFFLFFLVNENSLNMHFRILLHTNILSLTLALSMVNTQHHICSALDKQCAPIKNMTIEGIFLVCSCWLYKWKYIFCLRKRFLSDVNSTVFAWINICSNYHSFKIKSSSHNLWHFDLFLIHKILSGT